MSSVSHRNESYRLHILGSTTGVLIVMTALVWWWPTFVSVPSELPYRDQATDFVQIEEIQPTNHSQDLKPPPPAPLPPIVVPQDIIVEVEFDGSSNLVIDEPGEDATIQEGATGPTAARSTSVSARLFRTVQPEYPASARKADVRARVVVEVDVNEQGRVTDATVLRRERVNGSRTKLVSSLGYGIEESALSAARRSVFRPAQDNGEPVPTRTTITFTFGEETR
ncbi:energy transducer TonB [Longibacter salinarum]|uniref:Energy transducer TonB n=1 Tax=Longibacter salinarum TaxID=1850348 RepID=A0A2A8CYR7_9BACT|nr:energy transducer TonB [Longibacter salinarum]PEN13754.1 energy transducer TonB [Longibacter salinarum]